MNFSFPPEIRRPSIVILMLTCVSFEYILVILERDWGYIRSRVLVKATEERIGETNVSNEYQASIPFTRTDVVSFRAIKAAIEKEEVENGVMHNKSPKSGARLLSSEHLHEGNLTTQGSSWCNEVMGNDSANCHGRNGCWCYCQHDNLKRSVGYFGEFGYELVSALPYTHGLFLAGDLEKSVGTKGSRFLYFFSPNHEEKQIGRKVCTGLFDRSNHDRPFNFSGWHPPQLKAYYGNSTLRDKLSTIFNKDIFLKDGKIAIVHNKYNKEWGKMPINYIPSVVLSRLFEVLSDHTIFYIRLKANTLRESGSVDAEIMDLPDEDICLRLHPHVVDLNGYMASSKIDFNELQLILHAQSSVYISVQGGTSILSSYFGSVNFVYARQGGELAPPSEYETIFPMLSNTSIFVFQNYTNLIREVQEYASRAKQQLRKSPQKESIVPGPWVPGNEVVPLVGMILLISTVLVSLWGLKIAYYEKGRRGCI